MSPRGRLGRSEAGTHPGALNALEGVQCAGSRSSCEEVDRVLLLRPREPRYQLGACTESGGGDRTLPLSQPAYQRLRIEHPFIAVNILEDAIVSLDTLFRRVSQEVATFYRYVYGGGVR